MNNLKLEVPHQNLETNPSQYRFKKTVLLTGAGFTKNFGGYLREEMWTSIFNNKILQSCEPLRDRMMQSFDSGDFDYESAYQSLLDDKSITDLRTQLFFEVLAESYKKLDNTISSWNPCEGKIGGSGYHDTLINFISKFSGSETEKGAFFTLNQDLFIERHYRGSLDYPGAVAPCLMNDLNKSRRPLAEDQFVTVKWQNHPLRDEEKRHFDSCAYVYVKLHGSFNWYDDIKSHIIITGGNKEKQIKKYYFLNSYHELFRKAICQENAKLLVIGYGFRDNHINSVIEDAIKDYNLQVYIISSESLSDLSKRLQCGYLQIFLALKKGLAGYFKDQLLNIFPLNQRETINAKNLTESLFS